MNKLLKIPNVSKQTKAGKLIKKNELFSSGAFEEFTVTEDRNNLQMNKTEYNSYIQNLSDGNTPYIISGKLQNQIKTSFQSDNKNKQASALKRQFSFQFKAKANLSDSELRSVIGNKLRKEFLNPRDGLSNNRLVGFSFNVVAVPNDFKFTSRSRMYQLSHLESQLFKTLSEPIELSYNCVIDYLYNEFQKINTKVNKDIIIKNFKSVNCDPEQGVTVDNFVDFMAKYHKKKRYTILSPAFDCLIKHIPPLNNAEIHLCFYVNNNHLYPINDKKTQEYIARMLTKNDKYNFQNHFHEMIIPKSNKYTYMDDNNTDDYKHNEGNYILNKNIDINKYCIQLIEKENTYPDYINLDHKTGKIIEFTHPTKPIIYKAYEEYHNRKSICRILNEKFKSTFINFKNQSYATIANTLINYIDDIPTSSYNKEAHHQLNTYEPKPIIQILKDCKKEEVYQLDYYKQYSTIFYKDFEELDIKIPVYDLINTIEEYKKGHISIGEYFVKQKVYKGFKLFGCFLNYKVVLILLEKKIITKDDITHCITTKKYYTPNSFKTFVETTAELDEHDFKKLNNILNGSLKNSKIRNSKCFFTSDIDSLCYITNYAYNNNYDIKWNYDENTGYHFIKLISEGSNYTNTSAFYRTTLSISILQTLNLLDKVSDYGEVVKILTDAVYYIPFNENKLCPMSDPPSKDILKNLGQYHYDEDKADLEEFEPSDILYKSYEIVKQNEYIRGAGGLGKTYSIVQKYKDSTDRILFTAFTNEAVYNLQKTIIEIIGHIPPNFKLQTFSSFIVSKSWLEEYDLVVVDEIITMPLRYITILENANIKKIVMGDKYQMPSIVNDKYEQEYDLDNYLEKFYNTTEKEFVNGKSRYNKATYNMLEKFKTTGLTKHLKKCSTLEDQIFKYNIASTNRKVAEINKKCCDHFHNNGIEFEFKPKSKGYDLCVEGVDYDDEEDEQATGKPYKLKIGVGCPLRCNNNDNLKDFCIMVGWRCKIIEINNDGVVVSGLLEVNNGIEEDTIAIDFTTLSKQFTVAYCMTVHKWQGQTIHEPFAIHETKREYAFKQGKNWITGNRRLCNINSIYTACSRTGNYKNIFIAKSDKLLSDKLNLWKPSNTQVEYNRKKSDRVVYANFTDNTYTHMFYTDKQFNRDKSENMLYDTFNCTKKQFVNIINTLCTSKKIEKEKVIISFKPLKSQTNKKTILYIRNDRVVVSYINEQGEKKETKMETSKKKDLESCYKQMLSKFPNAEIKTKLILSFV